MSSYNYLLSRKNSNRDKAINIVDLLKETKVREKKEKRQTIYVAAAAVSILALSGYIISK